MLPTLEIAKDILNDGLKSNPGSWGNHSRIAAHCAKSIASQCEDLDETKAYIFGLLHDIGRKFGKRHLGHVSDGYSYMRSLGYDEVAQICLTHSFHNQTLEDYIGKFDTTEIETELIIRSLKVAQYTDYDRLIQLCDAMAGSDGVVEIEKRMSDVRQRYGYYPLSKWDSNIQLREYFENKAKGNIYEIVSRQSPGLE